MFHGIFKKKDEPVFDQFASGKSELVWSGLEKLAIARVIVLACNTRRGPSPDFALIISHIKKLLNKFITAERQPHSAVGTSLDPTAYTYTFPNQGSEKTESGIDFFQN